MEPISALVVIIVAVLVGLALAVGIVAWLWRALQGANEDYRAREDARDNEIDDLRRQIHELREGRIADHVLLQEWIAYARRLGAQVRDFSGQEPPPEPASLPRDVTVDAVRLARGITGRFSASEIDGLAFELGIGNSVSGSTVDERARTLVSAARARGLLLRLVELCRQERPEGGF